MRYKNIFLFGSVQEVVATQSKYFIENSEKIVIYYIAARLSSEKNKLKLYKNGKLIEEKDAAISDNIFLCYFYIYYHYIHSLFTYFKKDEKIAVISYHPISFFLNSVWRLFRNYEVIYWVGDYFPKNTFYNMIYQSIAEYYHNRALYKLYLSNKLNRKLNNKLVETDTVKTVMWGVENKNLKNISIPKTLTICFVGLIKPSQGIEFLLKAIQKKKNIDLKLLGFAPTDLFSKYSAYIVNNNLEKRIFFPNKSFYGKDLEKQLRQCQIGIALYDTGTSSGTHYADPAKIKTYAIYGLPIIMTNISEITKYIKKFHAGEITTQNTDSIIKAIEKIKKNYSFYRQGVKNFVEYFSYETYYHQKFLFLERFWRKDQ